MPLTLAQAQALIPGSRLIGDGATVLLRVHSDTRTLQPGDFFVALRGDRFDGHDYLPQARAVGAVAALVEHLDSPADATTASGWGALVVPDSLLALQQLAAGWRRLRPLPLIAVTGSNGKTTVTQMIAAILNAWQGPAGLSTVGNLNNHIGVPLTLLRLRHDGAQPHRVAVLELGMNHPGEIATLAALASPTVALVNNAQREHQGPMGSVAAVARENGAVIEALPRDGIAVLPAADAHAEVWLRQAGERPVWRFAVSPADTASAAEQGRAAQADVLLHADWHADGQADAGVGAAASGDAGGGPGHWRLRLRTPLGSIETRLALPGRHNLHNAAAAAAAALAVGAPLAAVREGLADFRAVAGRSQGIRLQVDGQALILIDDSYNANPDSVLAAIDLLAGLPGPRWLVLGDMGEVGDQGPAFHAEVGAAARARALDIVWSAGELCRHLGVGRHFADVPALLAALAGEGLPRDAAGRGPASVLVKGSRFMGMERVVRALRARAQLAAQVAPTQGGPSCC